MLHAASFSALAGIRHGLFTRAGAVSDGPARRIGAAHAGWRGALAGLLEATLDAMERAGADRSRIAAALGPMIRQPSYEVGPDLVARFSAADDANARFFQPAPRAGHAL